MTGIPPEYYKSIEVELGSILTDVAKVISQSEVSEAQHFIAVGEYGLALETICGIIVEGHYTQSDPIGLLGGINTYGYAEQNPVRWTDRLGLVTNALPGDEECALEGDCSVIGGGGGGFIGGRGSGGSNTGAKGIADCAAPSQPATPPQWPGNNPAAAPPSTKWRGAPGSTPGSGQGNYYNPQTQESFRPDLHHPQPIGPHWDYRSPDGTWYRIMPDGTVVPK
jgi:hypothetical protein